MATGKRQHKPIYISTDLSKPNQKSTLATTEQSARAGYDVKTAKGTRSREDVYVWKYTCDNGTCAIEVLSWSWGTSNTR
jgi:hypothetical protein